MRRFWWSLVAVVVAVGGALWTWTNGDALWPQRSLPAASATVSTVAAAYLDAAVRHDCWFTAKLTQDNTWSWCFDPRMKAYRDVSAPGFVPASEAGVDEQCVSFTMTTAGSSDGTIVDGQEPWGLCFVRTTSGWRLHDQGQG